jgi:hypothetical protein
MRSLSRRVLPALHAAAWAATLPFSAACQGYAAPEGRATQSLGGEWRFALDRADAGVRERWFSRDLPDRISLPGILQAQGYGDEIGVDTPWVAALPRDMRWYLLPQYKAYTRPGAVKVPYLSQPPRHYLGAAWYQRDIELPASWRLKRVVVTLERPHWETTVYIDDRPAGSCHSLVAPHAFDLGLLPAGRHRLSIRVDNRMILPYRPDGHSVSDAEGAAWNGIVGKLELAATTPVWIEDAQVYPDVERKSARIELLIGNITGKAGSGTLAAGGASTPVSWDAAGGRAGIEVSLGPDAKTWSEFTPVLQHLAVRLTGGGADDMRELTFGLREIRRDGKHLLLNGGVIDIRATHDGGGFPLTGYPATDVGSWKRIIGICKEWGLNGMRFHSWCPPEAAFTAADELGFYLQPECGMWNAFDSGGQMYGVLNDETARLLKAYGNHPSFILLVASNEAHGDFQRQLPLWDRKWREADSRRLYADSSGFVVIPEPGRPFPADFVVTSGYGRIGRGRGPSGWFGADYEPALHAIDVPVIAHELGQWCAYPDFAVIQKFTGYLRPGNYEIMRDSAAAHGLLGQNKEVARASGRFQLACYKEEIEANLRTPSFSGFALLDLHDYLGQGGALIGLLDVFWESKGYVAPAEFRRFCNTTVPLARLRKRVYTTADSLDVDVELAHFGAMPLAAAVPQWRLEDGGGTVIVKGEWPARAIPIGKNLPLGKVNADLSGLRAPGEYRLVVGLRGTDFENDWNFWVYPARVDDSTPREILVTGDWPEAEARLAAGGRVLFQPRPQDLDSADPALSTVPIFWNRLMNPGGAWMLGLWCDAKHPALAGFPTKANCDWQWVDLVRDARALGMDSLPRDLQPIVQPIDDWNRNCKFGLLYECRVGAGRLLVCSVDLGSGRPGARSLRRSLLDYMAGGQFHPAAAVSAGDLRSQWATMRGGRQGGVGVAQPLPPSAPEVDAPPGVQVPATSGAPGSSK